MRLPKFYDKGTLKRTAIAVGILALLFLCFYAWQPWRYDLFERNPDKPLPRLPIGETGLFESGKRIAIVTAHPDDEAFYLGGTLFKLNDSGAKSTLLVLTDGTLRRADHAHPGPELWGRSDPPDSLNLHDRGAVKIRFLAVKSLPECVPHAAGCAGPRRAAARQAK